MEMFEVHLLSFILPAGKRFQPLWRIHQMQMTFMLCSEQAQSMFFFLNNEWNTCQGVKAPEPER